ncbi:MAG: DEAD/DEAH box helicase [Anaerolineae bacterium]
MQFEQLQLIEPLLRAVRSEGYTQPSPIQEQAIPHVLAGRDLLGCAQTGTGKTAAFALPILQRLYNNKVSGAPHLRVLVLSPTRELTAQIGDSFRAYGKHMHIRHATIFGGVNQTPQIDQLRRGAEVLVATPGRLLDLMGQGYVKLDRLEVLVLDEADRMLDMGFINDVRRIIASVPSQRQTLLFSATMPAEIQALADSILNDPARVAVTPVASTVEKIQQSVYFVEKSDKLPLLKHLLREPSMRRVLVFTRTKHGANKVVRLLEQATITAEAIHSNKSQSARERALSNFKGGRTRILVATDIAARGIDVDDITHVINFDLPNEPESYVHRIGRTARAGASGIAYSFCDTEERAYLRDIERLIQLNIPRVSEQPYLSELGLPPTTDLSPAARGRSGNYQRPANGNGSNRNGNDRGGDRQRSNNNGGYNGRNGGENRRSNSNGNRSYDNRNAGNGNPSGGGYRRDDDQSKSAGQNQQSQQPRQPRWESDRSSDSNSQSGNSRGNWRSDYGNRSRNGSPRRERSRA